MIHTDLFLSSFLSVVGGGLSRTFQADIPRAPWPSWEPRTSRPPSTHPISKAAFFLSLGGTEIQKKLLGSPPFLVVSSWLAWASHGKEEVLGPFRTNSC